MRNKMLTETASSSLTIPDSKLVKALDKKLTALEAYMLKCWMDNEKKEAVSREWKKQGRTTNSKEELDEQE